MPRRSFALGSTAFPFPPPDTPRLMNSDHRLVTSSRHPQPAAFNSFAAYDSGWVKVSNRANRNLEFHHGIGVTPTQLIILFSPDQRTSYAVHTAGGYVHGSNPVSLWMTPETITLSIHFGDPLYRKWDGDNAIWSLWSEGYFRVFANP